MYFINLKYEDYIELSSNDATALHKDINIYRQLVPMA